ncbi:hypothetical protein ZWY2020_058159 [Hordeum vulgare]|nr:hypothetical protein ZWY2020_058159 [Hordeum vulgare]
MRSLSSHLGGDCRGDYVPVTAAGKPAGGWFWALAADDDEDEDSQPDASSPTPSDLVCESLLAGHTEERVAKSIEGFIPSSDRAWNGTGCNDDERIEVLRRVVHRRTSASAVRPWKGPIPKVRLPALTLADFIDTWKQVPFRRKKRRSSGCKPPPANIPAKTDLGIRDSREHRLNTLLLTHGPETGSHGLLADGYMAHPSTLQDPRQESISSTLHCEYGTSLITDNTTPARVWPDYSGFPSTTGRARRVSKLAPTMAEPPPGSATGNRSEQISATVTKAAAAHREADGVPAGVHTRWTTAGTDARGGGTATAAGRGGGTVAGALTRAGGIAAAAGGSGRGSGGGHGYRYYGHNWNESYGGPGGGRGN